MNYTAETLHEWIEDCFNLGQNLTDWETSFLESVDDQLMISGHLTDRQVETLEKIYTEKTP